jgi:hypothetical protein
MIIRKTFLLFYLVCGAIFISGAISNAAAQTPWQNDSNPCEVGSPPSAQWPEVTAISAVDQFPWMTQPNETHGLTPVNWGTVVYDSNQGVCWLADANLAGNPEIRAKLGLPPVNPITGDGVNPDGTMDYATSQVFVKALNDYNNGQGFLGHNNWQLPSNPAVDATCSSYKSNNFGVLCTGSALGSLYNVGLAETYPASVVPYFFNVVWPFFNLQPGLYWAAELDTGGEVTFSFNTGIRGENTMKYNLFHVLPMTRTALGPTPMGTGVLPYRSGPAAGKAVYDTVTGLSWPLNANLPAFDNFGVTQTTDISPDATANPTNGKTLTVPLVDKDGDVLLNAKVSMEPCINGGSTGGFTTQWILAMNRSEYAGTKDWELPCIADLQNLYNDMQIAAGDTRLETPFPVGPFWRLQPGFYWACSRAAKTGPNGPCDYTQDAGGGLYWSFNFDDGFEGSDQPSKQFYVMVYYPALSH